MKRMEAVAQKSINKNRNGFGSAILIQNHAVKTASDTTSGMLRLIKTGRVKVSSLMRMFAAGVLSR